MGALIEAKEEVARQITAALAGMPSPPPVTTDPGALYPDPVAVLVGRALMIERGLAASAWYAEVQVFVVAGVSETPAIDELMFITAARIAEVAGAASFLEASYRTPGGSTDLPAREISIPLYVTEVTS